MGLIMTHPTQSLKGAHRQVGNITIIDLKGRITAGEGAAAFRDAIHKLTAAGQMQIVLNLAELVYIDSAVIGEMVGSCSTVRKLGGDIKLLNPQPRIAQLLEMTKLTSVFAIFTDEEAAVHSFPAEGGQA